MNTEYFESAEVSDVGRKRKNNEDACLRLPERGIFCVADGMGGQAGGDLASEAITTTLQQVFTGAAPAEDATFAGRIELFRRAANQASKWIKNFADEKVIGQMGSTVVALVIDPRNPARAAALHAGDSRLYRYRNGELKQITDDHSAVAALAAKLGRSPESIPAKYQNELMRAVGLSETVELEKTSVAIASGDVYLICSDGLTKMQTDEQIARILATSANEPIATVAQTLVNAANEAGGKDNVTVVLVKAGDLSSTTGQLGAEAEDDDQTVAAPATLVVKTTPPTLNFPSERATLAQPTTPPPTLIQKATTKIPGIKTEPKKNFPWGIVIASVIALAAGVGIWFAVGSKPIAPNPTDDFPFTPAPQPAATKISPDELNQKYQTALREAQAALQKNNFSLASTQAKAALAIRPNDPAASDIIRQIQLAMDWESARRFFGQGDYDTAAQICQTHTDADDFKGLAASCRTESSALAAAKNLFIAGDYSFIAQVQGQPYAGKSPFVELLNQAAGEQKLLAALAPLQTSGNWQAVTAALASPAYATVTNKPPFQQLGQWAKSQAGSGGHTP